MEYIWIKINNNNHTNNNSNNHKILIIIIKIKINIKIRQQIKINHKISNKIFKIKNIRQTQIKITSSSSSRINKPFKINNLVKMIKILCNKIIRLNPLFKIRKIRITVILNKKEFKYIYIYTYIYTKIYKM